MSIVSLTCDNIVSVATCCRTSGAASPSNSDDDNDDDRTPTPPPPPPTRSPRKSTNRRRPRQRATTSTSAATKATAAPRVQRRQPWRQARRRKQDENSEEEEDRRAEEAAIATAAAAAAAAAAATEAGDLRAEALNMYHVLDADADDPATTDYILVRADLVLASRAGPYAERLAPVAAGESLAQHWSTPPRSLFLSIHTTAVQGNTPQVGLLIDGRILRVVSGQGVRNRRNLITHVLITVRPLPSADLQTLIRI